MNVVQATPNQLPQVRRLQQLAHHRYVEFGAEDLPGLLAHSSTVLGQEKEEVWGFLAVQAEDRPPTLPAGAPTRAYLRTLMLRRGYLSNQNVGLLVGAVCRHLAERRETFQLIAYGNENWMVQALLNNGFAVTEQVQFFQLDWPARAAAALPTVVPVAQLQPATAGHLEPLAELDAATFDPIWHFGHKDLLELLLRCRAMVAHIDGHLAGYSAISTNSSGEAQLARLAVHPKMQGLGIGRQLLVDAIQHAGQEGYFRLVLNTQTHNARAQSLYRALVFYSIGRIVPVLTRITRNDESPA
jgi:ribosomal protein S18 acetylase RimI-like enzyme